MDRRVSERHHRHVPVKLWRVGEIDPLLGHTSDISRTGAFVVAVRILPTGTRLRLEIGETRGFWAEGVVVRSLKAPPELRRVKPAGMGIRFLGVPELVAELLSVMPTPPAQSFYDLEPEPVVVDEVPPAAPVDRAAASEIVGAVRFAVRYPNSGALEAAIVRDLAAGGLFVPSVDPASLDTMIVVEVSVAGIDRPAAEISARVVHRIAPQSGVGGPNLMAGMGVEVVDLDAAKEALLRLLG